jgi:plastocyanin
MFSITRRGVWPAVAAAVLIAAPALAQEAAPPSYTAMEGDPADPATYRWYLTETTATDVTIAQGATVTFTNPASALRRHNVHFADDAKPACRLSTSDTASTDPMPAQPARNWTGTCAFAQPGAYHFVCDFHPAMTGTITVTPAPVSPTPAATSSPQPAAGGPAPAGGAAPAFSPLAAIWVTVGHHQRRAPVRGSLIVSRPGTRIDISLLSRRVALGLSGRRRVRVGRFTVAAAPAGPMRFSVTPDRRARHALRVRGTLPVLVRVKATAPGTSPVDRLQAVRLGRPPGVR